MKSSLHLSSLSLAIAAAFVAGALCAGRASAADGVAAYVAPAQFNPYSPAYLHPYRHGVIPTLRVQALMNAWKKSHPGVNTTGPNTLAYGGGTNGVGVLSGRSKVYLVFYGNQWGNPSRDSNGNLTFSGDASGAAPATQQMYKGIGTNGETWTADLTQWCDGAGVSSGDTTCPTSGASFVPYQQKVLAGVWYDNTRTSPAAATFTELGNEAINAATHFGNTTAASNRFAYYVILSPHGTNPDNYQGAYCAWHSYTVGSGTTAAYGALAFSNQPYNTDVSDCGKGFLNNPGTLDGYTMTLGHEWHEMMSDEDPPGGWTNHTNNNENSDECAWIPSGQPGGAVNVAFGTGTFAEQASWSNDTNECDSSHTILSHSGGGGTPTANFSAVASSATVNFTDASTDSGGTINAYLWNFGDGSTSTAASPSHTYAAAGTYSVTETVTDSVSLLPSSKVAPVALGISAAWSQLFTNTSFEYPGAWVPSSGVLCTVSTCGGERARSGIGFAWLDGYGTAHTSTLSRTMTIPGNKTQATLQFYLHIDTAETTTTAKNDVLTVALYNGATLLKTLGVYTNLGANKSFGLHAFDVSSYIGQTVTLKFTGRENGSLQTSFVIDDVTLTAQ